MKFLPVSTLCALVFTAAPACKGKEAAPWRVEGALRAWTVEGKFTKGKDLSGACLTAAGKGVVVSDETRSLQLFNLDPAKRSIRAGAEITLLPGNGTELDLEAVALATDKRHLYLLGSHSKARKKDVIEETRGHLFQVPVDPATGTVQNAGHARTSLRQWISATPELAAALDAPADGTGLDLEGMAERDGILFIGVRAPLPDGKAVVLEAPAKDLFGPAAAKPSALKAHKLPLGPGQGIRSMEWTRAGFLLVSGSAAPDPGQGARFQLWLWAGPGSEPQEISELHNLPGKPEGMMTLSEKPESMELLFWFDGAKNGAPRSLLLHRPDQP